MPAEHPGHEIDLRAADRVIVDNILRMHLAPEFSVRVFGSRANGRARRGSDLDLAVEGPMCLATPVRGLIADAFEESMLPMRVDLVDLHDVDDAFAEIIRSSSLPWHFAANEHLAVER